MERIRRFDELLEYADTNGIYIFPTSAMWHDGDIIESDDVDIVERQLVIDGEKISVKSVDVGVFENGRLCFVAESADYTEYWVTCSYSPLRKTYAE